MELPLLSAAETFKMASAKLRPANAVSDTDVGHAIEGGSRSTTVTLNEHCARLLDESKAEQSTTVTPIGKSVPD